MGNECDSLCPKPRETRGMIYSNFFDRTIHYFSCVKYEILGKVLLLFLTKEVNTWRFIVKKSFVRALNNFYPRKDL